MKKKTSIQSPVKIQYRDSIQPPRLGPQQAIISEASIKSINDIGSRNNIKIPQIKISGPASKSPSRENDFAPLPSPNQGYSGQKESAYTFPNGDTYIGTWRDKLFEGYGVYTFTKQGLQYRGQFKQGQQHGNGVLLSIPTNSQSKHEQIYDGEWMYGEKHGLGKYYYLKDTFYDGNWYKNTKQGHGTFKSSEGEYVGQWKNDKKFGKGILRLKNGHTFEGRWQNDDFIEGTLIHSNGDKYDGQLRNFLREGYGSYSYSNKSFYKGYWSENSKNGAGEIKYSNGDSFNGSLRQDVRQGNDCSYKWATGEQIIGRFQNNLPVSGRIRLPGEGQFEFKLK